MEPSIFKTETCCWLDTGEVCFRQTGRCRFLDTEYGCLIAAYLKCKQEQRDGRIRCEDGIEAAREPFC